MANQILIFFFGKKLWYYYQFYQIKAFFNKAKFECNHIISKLIEILLSQKYFLGKKLK